MDDREDRGRKGVRRRGGDRERARENARNTRQIQEGRPRTRERQRIRNIRAAVRCKHGVSTAQGKSVFSGSCQQTGRHTVPFLLTPNRLFLHAVEHSEIYGSGQKTGNRTFPVVDLNRIFLTFERAALYGAGQTTGKHTVPFF